MENKIIAEAVSADWRLPMEKNVNSSIVLINEQLKGKVLQRLPGSGKIQTDVGGLLLARIDEADRCASCFYRPTISVVLQGFKRSIIGNEEYRYGEGSCMVAGVDMPSVSQIIDASKKKPFLALSVNLDRYLVTRLAVDVPPAQKPVSGSYKGIAIDDSTPELLDAFLRLVHLLEKPARIPILAPMIIREIHYYLLTGPQGWCMRLVSTLGTQSNQIAQAISWLRENYRESLQIDALAKRVNMAESTFHRHFRQVTTLSPLQFQKRLRLYEAQRLMLVGDEDAATAALAVGYESVTQFNREYKREFGEPPHRDVSRMRAAGLVASPDGPDNIRAV